MSTPTNIDSKGYGKIYKAIMRNRQLPLLAKTIYAYFCAYAGNTTKAFPKRDKIVRDLKMNKDTYTKHLNTLVAEGYIAKERTATGNVYTIMQTVPGYDASAKASDDKLTDLLVFENVQARGFGTIPKLVMLDPRLTAQAKAIYAYFASFAGAGTTAFPRRSTIMRELKLSVNTYYDHLGSLIETGYLTVEQHKTDGRFDVCIYHLPDCVEAPPAAGKHSEAVSEKMRHGKNGGSISNKSDSGELQAPMSEELIHGSNLLKTASATSEKPMSEKLLSGKTVSQNFGHPNNNNISTRNSYFMSEQEYNHHGTQPRPDDNKPVHSFSLGELKRRMNFERLQSEASGWGNLKEMLGHFSTPADKERYHRVVGEILDELALQLTAEVNKSKTPEHIFTALDGDAFRRMLDDILDRWDEIRSVKGYVRASLKNCFTTS